MTKLDRTWKNCLRMWKWILTQLPKGYMKLTFDEKKEIVTPLKGQWLKQNGFTREIDSNCFFCDYNGCGGCVSCPAKLVDNNFHCNMVKAYSWIVNPKAFYRKLLELDKKRKKQN